jgi:hypothetical protein
MYVQITPLLLRSPSKARPATVGGRAIGASTSGRKIRVTFGFDCTSHHASGTPRMSEISAANTDVQRDNFTAVNESPLLRLEKNVDQGTFTTRAKIGSDMTQIAI